MIKLPDNFKEIAYKIWGGVPTDIEWAVNTIVYKDYIKQILK